MSKQIKLIVKTGYANAQHTDYIELPDGWEEWSDDDQEVYLQELADDFLYNCCECWAGVVEEEE